MGASGKCAAFGYKQGHVWSTPLIDPPSKQVVNTASFLPALRSWISSRLLHTMSSPFFRTAATVSRGIMRAGPRKASSTALNGDARNDLIKRVLFDAPSRPPIRLSPEDQARHETIERAWKLVRQLARQENEKTLAKKFEMMRKANAELEATSPSLFKHSQTKERNAVFPRQLRTLTDTPPKQIWNYRTATNTASKA